MFDKDTRILLVEDTDITRSIEKRMLEKFGYRKITEIGNGTMAWEELERAQKARNPYHLVIADWNMPGMNGLELFKKIHSDPNLKSTCYIMLTSNIEKEHVVEAIRSGVTCYLAKPFSAAALERKIREAWEFSQKKKTA